MYAVRRVRDAFRENKNTTNVQQQYKFATDNLELIKRQVSAENELICSEPYEPCSRNVLIVGFCVPCFCR